MEKLALAVCALLAFLLPIGFYCLILASINRRSRPLIVSGLWDSVGLLFAVSGFFLITVPMLLSEFFVRTFSLDPTDEFLDIWLQHWIVYLAYFCLLIFGSVFVVLWRSQKTMIYNVDAEQFPRALEHAFATVGLAVHLKGERLLLTPIAPPSDSTAIAETAVKPAPPEDTRRGELEIESFASLCHITLNWGDHTPSVRREVERELNKNLESAAPLDNPGAGWLLNISGMIFGTLVMAVMTFSALVFFLVRH